MNFQYLEQNFPIAVTALNQFKRYQVQLSWAVFGSMLAVSAWQVGSMVWMPFQSNTINTWHPTAVSHLSPAKSVDLTSIKQKNLFGISPLSAQGGYAKNAPQTQLNLSLVGVVVSQNAKDSLAIIAKQKTQTTYGVGETITGTRAKLKAVYEDRVIINNVGKNETLMLKDVNYSTVSSKHDTYSHESPMGVMPGNVYGKRPPSIDNTKDILGTIKRELAKDPQTILQYVHFSKTEESGKIVGYKLTPGKVPQFFSSLGLESGDIATAVNDVDLTDPKALMELMGQLKDIDSLNLTVERDGESKDIFIQF